MKREIQVGRSSNVQANPENIPTVSGECTTVVGASQ